MKGCAQRIFSDIEGGCVACVFWPEDMDMDGGEALLFSLPECVLVAKIPLASTSCRIAISLADDRVAVAIWSGGLTVYSISTGQLVWTRRNVSETQAVWIRDGKIFCTETKTGLQIFTLEGNSLPIPKAIESRWWPLEPHHNGWVSRAGNGFSFLSRDLEEVLFSSDAAHSIMSCASNERVMIASLFPNQRSFPASPIPGLDYPDVEPEDVETESLPPGYSAEYPPFQAWYISEGWLDGVPPSLLNSSIVNALCYSRVNESFYAVFREIEGSEKDALISFGGDCLETRVIAYLPNECGYEFSGDGQYLVTELGSVYRTSDGSFVKLLWPRVPEVGN